MPEGEVPLQMEAIIKQAEQQTSSVLTGEAPVDQPSSPAQTETASAASPAPAEDKEPAPPVDEGEEGQAPDAGEEATDPHAEETEAPATPRTETKEVAPQRRQQERAQVAKNVVFRKIDTLAQQLKEHPDQQNQILATEGARQLNSLGNLMNMEKTGTYTVVDADGKRTEGIDFSNGNAIIVEHDGAKWQLLTIKGRNERQFLCRVRSTDGSTENTIPVPDAAVVSAYLSAESTDILKEFSGAEQKVVAGYITEQQGKQLAETDEANSDATIKEAATATGIPLTEDVKAYVSHLEQTPENIKILEEVDKLLNGKNVLDYDTMSEVMGALGVSPEAMGAEVQKLSAELSKQQEILASDPTNQEAQDAVTKLSQQIDIYQRAEQALGEDGKMAEYFNQVLEGKVDLDSAKQLSQALREGDQEKMLELILSGMTELSGEELEEKREELHNLLSAAGRGAGLMLALIFNALVSDEAKTMYRSLK